MLAVEAVKDPIFLFAHLSYRTNNAKNLKFKIRRERKEENGSGRLIIHTIEHIIVTLCFRMSRRRGLEGVPFPLLPSCSFHFASFPNQII